MKIALIGYGKMGKTIEQLAQAKNHEIVLIINSKNQAQFNTENLLKADVAIEMTGPESAYQNVKKCIEVGIPTVTGSTGWIEKLPEIEALVHNKNGSFLYAGNFSVGVNIFFSAVKYLANIMKNYPNYHASIHETHHTQKKDMPSGTALAMLDILKQYDANASKWELNPEIETSHFPVFAYRKEDVPGIHSLQYANEIDEITIQHSAKNRLGFADGAIRAAEFVSTKKGVFTMQQVLGLSYLAEVK